MKRIGVALLAFFLALVPLAGAPMIPLLGSNQNLSTMGFEFNEYDALVNPLRFEKIGGNRLFFALDIDTSLLGEQYDSIASKGFNGGLLLGAPLAPRFMLDYADGSSVSSSTVADNTVVTRSGYNIASGLYDEIVESVDVQPSYSRNVRDLIVHGGLVVSPGVALALQVLWRQRDYAVSWLSYQNAYEDAAAVSPASLTSMGNRTETWNSLPGGGNALSLQLQAGLSFGKFTTLASLGAGFLEASGADASYAETVSTYDEGVDFTVLDRTTTTTYSGAYRTNGTLGSHDAGLGMASAPSLASLPRTAITLDTQNALALGNGLELSFPLSFGVNLIPEGLASVQTVEILNYDDTIDPAASYSAGTTTVTATTLDADYSLAFAGGAGLKKTFQVAQDASFYAGAKLDLFANLDSGSVARTRSTRTVIDLNADGTLTPGTDSDTTILEDGYETAGSNGVYRVGIGIPIGASYTPFPKLSFHAGCDTAFNATITAASQRYNAVGDYTYSTFTDALVPANSTARQQINGSDDNITSVDSVGAVFGMSANSAFGFTLRISDKFTIDALAQVDSVSFSSFAVIGSIAY